MLDFEGVADRLGVEVAALQAVYAVESLRRGFLRDGRPIILFEAHIFHRETNGKFAGARDRHGVLLSVPEWDKSLYGASGAHQYERLEDAMALNEKAAVQATSWGAFQVMGFNFDELGHPKLKTYAEAIALTDTDEKQMDLFVRYIERNNLVDALRDKDWKKFARGYNGAGYRENKYDDKMRDAYHELKGREPKGKALKRGDRGCAVAKLQEFLHIESDGIFGQDTEDAVRAYQRERGLDVDGKAGRATHAALGLPWPPQE